MTYREIEGGGRDRGRDRESLREIENIQRVEICVKDKDANRSDASDASPVPAGQSNHA